MAQFLTTSGIANNTETIINRSNSKLVLLSPYMKLSRTLFERLKDADHKGVEITIICREDDLKEEDRKKLSELKKLNLYSRDNLHAKCYFNEDQMIITSMNLHEFSANNNREMGILLTRDLDNQLFNEAREECESIKRGSKKIPLSYRAKTYNWGSKPIKTKRIDIIKGYCIRCGKPITKNLGKPFCPPCFKKWSKHNDPYFEEFYCHYCGREAITSMNKPRCYSCWKAVS